MKQSKEFTGDTVWSESTAVTSKIGKFDKLNTFISSYYSDELKQAKKQYVTGHNNFDLDKKCNSMLGYCVEYYSKYLVYGKEYLKREISLAQNEMNAKYISNEVIVRACIIKYRIAMILCYGIEALKHIKAISAKNIKSREYKYFISLIIELGRKTADYVKKTLYPSTKPRNNFDLNLSIRHITGVADYITEDTILDVKVRNCLDEKSVRQVLAYHYLSTKRSDLHIKRVIVYDATSDKSVVINISADKTGDNNSFDLIDKEKKDYGCDNTNKCLRIEERRKCDVAENKNKRLDEERERLKLIADNAKRNLALHKTKVIAELNRLGFNVDKDFPDYDHFRGENYNLDIIKTIIDNSIKNGYNVAVYKGLKTRQISKIYICYENGIPEDKVIDYSSDFCRVADLRLHFKNLKK